MTSRHPTYSRYLETVEHKTVLGVSSHIVSVKKKVPSRSFIKDSGRTSYIYRLLVFLFVLYG